MLLLPGSQTQVQREEVFGCVTSTAMMHLSLHLTPCVSTLNQYESFSKRRESDCAISFLSVSCGQECGLHKGLFTKGLVQTWEGGRVDFFEARGGSWIVRSELESPRLASWLVFRLWTSSTFISLPNQAKMFHFPSSPTSSRSRCVHSECSGRSRGKPLSAVSTGNEGALLYGALAQVGRAEGKHVTSQLAWPQLSGLCSLGQNEEGLPDLAHEELKTQDILQVLHTSPGGFGRGRQGRWSDTSEDNCKTMHSIFHHDLFDLNKLNNE